LYFSVPSEKSIYKNEYDKGKREENNNHFGTVTKIYENRKETSWITSMDCNRKADGIYWFNAADSKSLQK